MTLRRFFRPCSGIAAPFSASHTRRREETLSQHATRVSRRGISLKDLAAAFGEMASEGTSTPAPASSSSSSLPLSGHPNRPSSERGRSEKVSSLSGVPISAPKIVFASQGSKSAGNTSPRTQQRTKVPLSRLDNASSAPSPSTRATPRHARPSIVLTLSTGYAQQLSRMQEPQLLAEMENGYRRVHYSIMVQCLMELTRRVCLVRDVSEAASQQKQTGMLPRGNCHKTLWLTEAEAAGTLDAQAAADMLSQALSLSPFSLPAGGLTPSTASLLLCRTDRMLEAALRCLTKMNLAQLEPDVDAALHAHRQSVSRRRHGATLTFQERLSESAMDVAVREGSSLSYALGNDLLVWLTTRVSYYDTARSLTFLHLLAQQRLFFSDDVLATLVDNLLTGCSEASHGPPPLPARQNPQTETAPSPLHAPLSLKDFSLSFDTIARCEALLHFAGARWLTARQQLAAQRLAQRRQLEREGIDGAFFVDDQDEEGRGGGAVVVGREMATAMGSHHPVCNAEVYHCLATRLIQAFHEKREALRARQQEHERHRQKEMREAGRNERDDAAVYATLFPRDTYDKSLTPPATASQPTRAAARNTGNAWDELDPVSFFFLTRALARIRFFHDGLVAALLPGMAAYLQRHTEHFLGVVLLVGRPENAAADPALTCVLVDTLTMRLERRVGALARAPRIPVGGAPKDAAPAVAAAAAGSPKAETNNDTATCDESLSLLLAEHTDPTLSSTVEADHEDSLLLSDAGSHNFHRTLHEATAKTSTSRPPHTFAVGLIDTPTLPAFLAALTHQYQLSLTLLVRHGPQEGHVTTAHTLQRKLRHLVTLLLDDAHRGVPSLASLFRLSPMLVTQLLAQVLATNDTVLEPLLNVASADDSTGKWETAEAPTDSDARRLLQHHPLLIELAYVWTQHVAHSRVVPDAGAKSLKGGILERLLQTQVLERVAVLQRQGTTHDSDSSRSGTGRGSGQGGPSRNRYSSQQPPARHVSHQRVSCYVMPLPLLQTEAPRVLAHIHEAFSDAEERQWQSARREHERGQGNAKETVAGDGAPRKHAADVLLRASQPDDKATAKQQKKLLVRHFRRFSAAAGAGEDRWSGQMNRRRRLV